MYTEISTILDVLFFEKRNRFIMIFAILVISGLFAWYFSVDTTTEKNGLIKTEKIQLSKTQSGAEYGSNQDYFYALLPEMYFKVPKINQCPNFQQTDFTTWCEEGGVPHSY